MYIVKKKNNGTFTSNINQIEDVGNHGIYHYLSQSFYNILLNTNLSLKEIYHTWYLISKEKLLKEHSLLRYNQDNDQRGVRYYFNNVTGDLDMDEMIAPRTEINLYIKNVNNQDKNYFLKRERVF